MELDEFVKLDPNKVRRDNKLMQLFVDFYKAAFSVTPNCAGCVFRGGFEKLKTYAKTADDSQKISTFTSNNLKTNAKMENEEKNFELKKQYRLKILTYNEDGITYRKYGYNLTNAFALKLVEHGKADLFTKAPNTEAAVTEVEDVAQHIEDELNESEDLVHFEAMDYQAELLPLYKEKKELTGSKAKSTKKADIIEFLKQHE